LGQVLCPTLPAPGTYAGYEGTTFTLIAELNIDASANVSDMATLSYGNVLPAPKEITLTAGFTPTVVTGVGVSVTSSKNNYIFVRVRLLSFTLSATPCSSASTLRQSQHTNPFARSK
jgi:hypothetical protein